MIVWRQDYPPNGRIIARIGNVDMGAVFPVHGGGFDWRRFQLGSCQPVTGTKKTELAAKSALAGSVYDWMRTAGLIFGCAESGNGISGGDVGQEGVSPVSAAENGVEAT